MAYPPDPIAADKTAATPIDVDDDHPDHHNALATAINDLVGELGSGPSGASDDLTARLSALDTTVAAKATSAALTAHIDDTSDAHDASAISIADAGNDFTATDVEGALAELQADAEADDAALAAHLADGTDAHDASAISYGGGTGMSATDVEGAIDELATEKLSALTPWTSDIDGDGFTLTDVGGIGIGSVALPSTINFQIDNDKTTTAAGGRTDMFIASTMTYNTTAGGSYTGVSVQPTVSGNANISTVNGMLFNPTMNPNVTITAANGGQFNLNHGIGTLTTGIGLKVTLAETLGTLTTGIGLDVISSNSAGTITTMIGLRVTQLNGGTTKWGMQVGDYQSYHHGKLTLGGTTAPTYGLDLIGTAQDRAAIALKESATPTNPSSSDQVVIYCVSNKIVFAWNDGGTMRYKYLDLTGTGVTWTHSTTAP